MTMDGGKWLFHALATLLNYSLTPWSRVLLEKLISSQLVKKFPVFLANWRFLTAVTSACHLSYPEPEWSILPLEI